MPYLNLYNWKRNLPLQLTTMMNMWNIHFIFIFWSFLGHPEQCSGLTLTPASAQGSFLAMLGYIRGRRGKEMGQATSKVELNSLSIYPTQHFLCDKKRHNSDDIAVDNSQKVHQRILEEHTVTDESVLSELSILNATSHTSARDPVFRQRNLDDSSPHPMLSWPTMSGAFKHLLFQPSQHILPTYWESLNFFLIRRTPLDI